MKKHYTEKIAEIIDKEIRKQVEIGEENMDFQELYKWQFDNYQIETKYWTQEQIDFMEQEAIESIRLEQEEIERIKQKIHYLLMDIEQASYNIGQYSQIREIMAISESHTKQEIIELEAQ